MDFYVILIIIITAAIQSFFAVGVLLFGTPLMLLLGYPFFETLVVLLPVSLLINILQIYKDFTYLNKNLYFDVLKFTVPFIVISLYLISKINYDPTMLIGFFLLLISIKNYVLILDQGLQIIFKFNKSYLIFMGIVHGLTNLGGSLLTAKVFRENLNKIETRSTIAFSYMTFAVFQIITVLLLDIYFKVEYFIYISVGFLVYLIMNKFFFHRVSDKRYNNIFSVFLALSGVMLILKGV